MTGTQKTVGWLLFAAVVAVLIIGSMPRHGIGDGHQGSYLGRSVSGQQPGQTQALGQRTATQRY